MRRVLRCAIRRTTVSRRHNTVDPPPSNTAYLTDPSIPMDHKAVLHELFQHLRFGVSLPVSSVTASLTEVSVQVMSNEGGFLNFSKMYSPFLEVVKNEQGILVVVSKLEYSTLLLAEEAYLLLCQLKESQSGQPVSIGLFHVKLTERRRRPLNFTFTTFLRQFSNMFRVTEDQNVEPVLGYKRNKTSVAAVSIADEPMVRNPPSSRTSAPTVVRSHVPFAPGGPAKNQPVAQQEMFGGVDPRMMSTATILLRYVPFSFFIPFLHLLEILPHEAKAAILNSIIPSTSNQQPQDDVLFAWLQKFPGELLDIRLLGDGIGNAYIRAVCEGVPIQATENGDVMNEQFQVWQLANELQEQLANCGAVNISDLTTILTKETMEKMPLRGYATILVFDRLQHLFDVDLTKYTVQVNLSKKSHFSDFNFYNSPCPAALRHILSLLLRAPLTPVQIEAKLPPVVQEEVQQTLGCVLSVVNAHRFFVFFQDGLVWTPVLSAEGKALCSNQGGVGPNVVISQKDLAKAIYEMLPVDHAVLWVHFATVVSRRFPGVRQSDIFSTTGEAGTFFLQYPELFDMYQVRFANGFVVQRKGLPRPRGVHDPVNSVNDVLRQIAMNCIGGEVETTIMQCISREAREICRRFGGFEHLVSQVPEWFEVHNPERKPGFSIVTYIGHLRQPDEQRKFVMHLAKPVFH